MYSHAPDGFNLSGVFVVWIGSHQKGTGADLPKRTGAFLIAAVQKWWQRHHEFPSMRNSSLPFHRHAVI